MSEKESRANRVSPAVAIEIVAWLDQVKGLGEESDRIEAIRDLLDERMPSEGNVILEMMETQKDIKELLVSILQLLQRSQGML